VGVIGDPPALLPRSTPSAQGIDAHSIAQLLDRLDNDGVECHSIMVVRHGHVVAEGWWAPFSAQRPHLLYSLTKSFTSTAVGLAMADGLLRLDDRVVDVLPDHVPADLAPGAGDITVEHLLSMTSGHRGDSLGEAWQLEPADLVKGFLRAPFEELAGTRHAYDNATSFVLARMVERVTGRSVADLLGERLFAPLGVEHAEWDRVGSGAVFGFHGLHLTTEAVAAFGELLLRQGRWHDRQVLPRDWVQLATTRHIETLQFEDGSRSADWLQGYGYHFWMSQHGYRGDGAYGQFCLVLPDADLVVAITAATTDMQAPLDAVWECLLPGIDQAPSIDDREVAARLSRLSLPLVAGGDEGGRSIRASIDATAENSALPHGTAVAIEPVAGGWTLTLGAEDTQVTIDIGLGTWRESSPLGRPVVACGGWQDGSFVADLYVITGPHRVRLVVDANKAVATWNCTPLTGLDMLRQLRSPLMTRPDVA
jgi:CubicO group peptidase (beta-lactamase class C family)